MKRTCDFYKIFSDSFAEKLLALPATPLELQIRKPNRNVLRRKANWFQCFNEHPITSHMFEEQVPCFQILLPATLDIPKNKTVALRYLKPEDWQTF